MMTAPHFTTTSNKSVLKWWLVEIHAVAVVQQVLIASCLVLSRVKWLGIYVRRCLKDGIRPSSLSLVDSRWLRLPAMSEKEEQKSRLPFLPSRAPPR